ncbi:hypothetical protein AGRA3207_002347 [Actinomadura graeca]|uniref:Fibronectin type-III domain-containing protein n=1 Tax=Actinomadura graeca TaxID=2750812 RepID=A0ABX8QXK4_9ACTN|nr:fibronectin type III domain-containing protein [Actinomadura graeca]QXJ21488.1 hypothetical protein AGRA3207_002347 [Actinomadura graeca]
MTAGGERPNYFVLLEIDPDAPWDRMVFERTLSEAQKQWTRRSMGLQSLPATAEAKRLLGLLKDIRQVMGDPEQRKAEGDRARKQARAARLARRKEFKARFALMARRGFVLQTEVTVLYEDFGDILAADPGLREQLDGAPVRPVQDGPAGSRLDERTETQLRDLLESARERSIYDVLKTADPAVNEQSPRETLLAAADMLYLRQHHRKNKQDPAIKALERLSGLAKTSLFQSDEQRARLDASMRLEKLRELVEWFLDVLGTARSVSGGQVEAFLEEARTRGVDDLSVALGYLRERLAKDGWAVELPAPEDEDRVRGMVQCPRCAGLNGTDAETCFVCAFPLREPCPSCGAVEPRFGGCRCGFPIGQRDVVDDLAVQASEALDAHRLAQAETYLDRAERIWRLPARSEDPVSVRLAKVRTRWTAATREIERLLAAIEPLMGTRQYVAAAGLLRAAPDGLPRRREMLARAETMIGEARELCEVARRQATPKARSIELYSEALRLCADLEPARVELAGIPPDPPAGVRATVAGEAAEVLVTWEKSPDPDVSYVVVRRSGPDAPESADDLPGQRRVAEDAEPPLRDRSAAEVAGRPLTYAVFAVRFGARSAPGVAATVLAALDAEVRCEAGDGRITLTWEPPPRAVRVEVTRREPGGTGPPVVLEPTGPSRLVDTGVRNGVRYEYTVRAGYPGPDGLCWSAGRSEQATPTPRPAPPGPLLLTGSSARYGLYAHKTDIRFPLPERGEVRIVRQDGAGSLREGDEGPRDRLRLDGFVLSGEPPLSDPIFDRGSEFLSYVPVLMLDGMAYVGRPRRYAIREEVVDLRGEFAGRTLALGWWWPEGSGRALVGHRTSGELLDVTAVDRPLTVTRAAGETTGGCAVPVPAGETAVNVIVALVVQKDGLDFVTGGVRREFTRPETRVEYHVRRSGGRRPVLVLTASAPVDLPALVLRGRSGGAVFTREDGDVVAAIGPVRVDGHHTVPLPKSGAQDIDYRLFTASPGAASSVELVLRTVTA